MEKGDTTRRTCLDEDEDDTGDGVPSELELEGERVCLAITSGFGGLLRFSWGKSWVCTWTLGESWAWTWTLGSMLSRSRRSQPRLALKDASASRLLSDLVI